MKRTRAVASLVMALGWWASSSCAPSDFADERLISSVRILAASADPPYAKPGTLVTVRALAYDGRTTKPAPMTISWLPAVCMNPTNDAYYACFREFAGGGQGAADAGATAPPNSALTALVPCGGGGNGAGTPSGPWQPRVDLSHFLPQGDCVEFTMPADAVSAHPTTPSQTDPYGLAILFNVACAGHLELVPLDPGNVQSPPIGCFDEQHNRLGPSDYVIGLTRVYAYETLQNANPVIDHVDVDGQMLDLQLGLQLPYCPPSPRKESADGGPHCAHVHIGPVVPASSQENNPQARDAYGHPLREQIWAQYFTTFGSFASEVRLLYDANGGSLGGPSDTDNEFEPPNHPGDGTIWIVVHDNRGGATWATIPVHVS